MRYRKTPRKRFMKMALTNCHRLKTAFFEHLLVAEDKWRALVTQLVRLERLVLEKPEWQELLAQKTNLTTEELRSPLAAARALIRAGRVFNRNDERGEQLAEILAACYENRISENDLAQTILKFDASLQKIVEDLD